MNYLFICEKQYEGTPRWGIYKRVEKDEVSGWLGGYQLIRHGQTTCWLSAFSFDFFERHVTPSYYKVRECDTLDAAEAEVLLFAL